jgi:hypothetical protein
MVVAQIGTYEIVVSIFIQLICLYYWLESSSGYKINSLSLLTICTTCPYQLVSPSRLTLYVSFGLENATNPSWVYCYCSSSRDNQHD